MEPPATIHCRRILVPIDFSPLSEKAAAFALRLARRFKSHIHLLHVVPTATPADVSHLGIVLHYRSLAANAAKEIRARRDRLAESGLPVDDLVLRGVPHFEICETARELNADLVIIPTHGHTGFAHLLLGSTAERVVRHAPCPVLVVPRLAAGAPLPDPPRFQTLLVPTDFSEPARKALPYAAAFAREFKATLHLLHVVEPPRFPLFGYARVPIHEAQACRAAREALGELSIQSPLSPMLRVRTHVRRGPAAPELAETACELRADLLIMATHGRTGLTHAFLGSVTEKTLRNAPCPTLVVREREHEFVTS